MKKLFSKDIIITTAALGSNYYSINYNALRENIFSDCTNDYNAFINLYKKEVETPRPFLLSEQAVFTISIYNKENTIKNYYNPIKEQKVVNNICRTQTIKGANYHAKFSHTDIEHITIPANNISMQLHTKTTSSILTNAVKIWNELTNSDSKAMYCKKVRNMLAQAFREHFSNKLEEWKKFCELISASDFLMGKIVTFKATLSWVIKPNNLKKILSGKYHNDDNKSANNIMHEAETLNIVKKDDKDIKTDYKINLYGLDESIGLTISHIKKVLAAGLNLEQIQNSIYAFAYDYNKEKDLATWERVSGRKYIEKPLAYLMSISESRNRV